MTSTLSTTAVRGPEAGPGRPTGAKLRRLRSLRTRLALLVALATTTVIGIEAFIETRVLEHEVERDLVSTARLTALAVADDFELRPAPVDRTEISSDLHELVQAAPSLRTLTIVEIAATGRTVVSSTSTGVRDEALDLAERAVRSGTTTVSESPAGMTSVAVPVTRTDGTRAAAVATVSLQPVQELRTKGRLVALWFTPAAIVVLTLLVDWLARRFYRRMFALREALARAQQMAAIGQTAASVAHQVGTPLNLVSGYVQMMREEMAGDARAVRRLEIVQEQIAKVASVVRALLDQSRRHREKRRVEVAPLLASVTDLARPKLEAAGIQPTLRIEPDLPAIDADAEELELAIVNLVTNALDAMPSGGSLAISAERKGDRLHIEVTDTGSGIPPDVLPRVFEPWVTTKPPGSGTGLGLSITRDAIARHGGTIAVTSQPGISTTVTIELPVPAEEHDGENPDR